MEGEANLPPPVRVILRHIPDGMSNSYLPVIDTTFDVVYGVNHVPTVWNIARKRWPTRLRKHAESSSGSRVVSEWLPLSFPRTTAVWSDETAAGEIRQLSLSIPLSSLRRAAGQPPDLPRSGGAVKGRCVSVRAWYVRLQLQASGVGAQLTNAGASHTSVVYVLLSTCL